MLLRGKVWKFDNDLGAYELLPARYDKEGMRKDWVACAKHVLEDTDPQFVQSVQQGDILVVRGNMGAGHAHYHLPAIMGCKTLGVSGFFAGSFNGLFSRVAINAGFPVWTYPELHQLVEQGDQVELELASGVLNNITQGRKTEMRPVPRELLSILEAGGLRPYTLQRLSVSA